MQIPRNLCKKEKIGEKLQRHTMLPIVVCQLNVMSRQLGHLKVQEGGWDEAEVTKITTTHKVIRHVVNLKNHTCSCREWQGSGKPCQHALALIIATRNPKMEDFLHPFFSVYHFRLHMLESLNHYLTSHNGRKWNLAIGCCLL